MRTATRRTAALFARPHRSGLRGKLWVAYVTQVLAISAATLLSVFVAWLVLRGVLIKEALHHEADHYWARDAREPGAALPDTANMRSFLRPAGTTRGVPAEFQDLPPGYHSVRMGDGHDGLVYVADGKPGRLYLVFLEEQVDSLALWFGLVPLTVALIVIYLATWMSYRASRRALSPLLWLAGVVRDWDPKQPNLNELEPHNLPPETDNEVKLLAGSIHGFASRIEEFVERERNFTRDASHELRSPLTVIKVAADVLAEETGSSEFAQRSALRIKRAARDMEALIEAFLILARESDRGLPEEDFVVNHAVADEVERARDLLGGKQVALKIEEQAQFALHAPLRVFSVLLSNLLRNACAYTEQGSVTITVGADFVRVADTGVGIAAEDLQNVFQPYFRGKHSGKAGHGIGLTIVKRLSERFGWPVDLQSTEGVGTTVTVRFPHPQPV